MTDRTLHHRRVHNLLLFQKLLQLREGVSPFTLLLDTIEQPAKPLLQHFIKNAKVAYPLTLPFLLLSLSLFAISKSQQWKSNAHVLRHPTQTSFSSHSKHLIPVPWASAHSSKDEGKASILCRRRFRPRARITSVSLLLSLLPLSSPSLNSSLPLHPPLY